MLVVRLLKNEQEFHLAETIIYEGYQVKHSRLIGGGSIVEPSQLILQWISWSQALHPLISKWMKTI